MLIIHRRRIAEEMARSIISWRGGPRCYSVARSCEFRV